MKVEVQKSFERDIFAIHDKNLAQRIRRVIEELEACRTISEIRHFKKIHSKGNYYRIRIGNYRLGLKLGPWCFNSPAIYASTGDL